MSKQDQKDLSLEFLTVWEDVENLLWEADAVHEAIGHAKFQQELFKEKLANVSMCLRRFYEKHRDYFELDYLDLGEKNG